jgi:hypothetical protein
VHKAVSKSASTAIELWDKGISGKTFREIPPALYYISEFDGTGFHLELRRK